MKYLTVVIEYGEEDIQPSFGFNQELLGGKIAGFMVGSFFDQQENFKDKAQRVLDIVDNCPSFRGAEEAIEILEDLSN